MKAKHLSFQEQTNDVTSQATTVLAFSRTMGKCLWPGKSQMLVGIEAH